MVHKQELDVEYIVDLVMDYCMISFSYCALK